MNWLWTIIGVAILAAGGYYLYDGATAPKPKPVLREGKAILKSKTRQHNALWIHYTYKDANGEEREMSERLRYVDVWESLKEGQEIEILYDNEGRSVLKKKITNRPQP